jgi:hypothetical protein
MTTPLPIQSTPPLARRIVFAGPAIALASLALALVVTAVAGVPLRDPDGVASGRLLVALGLVAVLVVVDVALRARRAVGGGVPPRALMATVARARWNRHRMVPLCMALFAFFATYFAYRNLKSVVPLLRDDLFDVQLRDLDLGMFGGRQPAELLHELLGTGVSAHALSTAYLLLFLFIPITLAVSLVFSSRLEPGLFYSTALALNWVVGAGSYFLLPSLGPFELDPSTFAGLPGTAVGDLQDLLLRERADFLADPTAPGAAQSIGAFASLHVSIFVTGALAAHLLGMRRSVKLLLWVLTGITVLSTVYFGWHYVLDDVGGAAIAVISLYLARVATGFDPVAATRGVVAPVAERA